MPDAKTFMNQSASSVNLVSYNFKTGVLHYFKFLFQFHVLWYSQLPCFDVNGTTSSIKNEKAMIKQCFWKAKELDCSAIFRDQNHKTSLACIKVDVNIDIGLF